MVHHDGTTLWQKIVPKYDRTTQYLDNSLILCSGLSINDVTEPITEYPKCVNNS